LAHDTAPGFPIVNWIWSGPEIDQPKHLKSVIEQLHAQGVKELRIRFLDCPYRFTDLKVIRAIARASQWAKIRDIHFWLHIDPRQASRFFLSNTSENTSFLMLQAGFGKFEPNISPIKNNQYSLSFDWNGRLTSSQLQENGLHLNPDSLEKVFLFQMEEGIILKNTLSDITDEAHLQFDTAACKAHIFGEVHLPANQNWHVLAYPKFSSNLFDYCGRLSNDLLCNFVENLFDGCTHIDGITWGEGGPVEITEPALLPVSLSIYNSYKAEFGYDLRDRLYCLSLPVEDDLHLKTRADYYRFMRQLVKETRTDFHRMMHAFFGTVEQGLHFDEPDRLKLAGLAIGDSDPWQKSRNTIRTFGTTSTQTADDHFLMDLIMIKSLKHGLSAVMSSLSYLDKITNLKTAKHMNNLAMLFSIIPAPSLRYEKVNMPPDENINLIAAHTGFNLPEADTLVIFPLESIETASSDSANRIYKDLSKFCVYLLKENIQFDLLSPNLLQTPVFNQKQFIVNSRIYKRILYPFPQVINAKLMDLLISARQQGFPVFFGGSVPRTTLEGNKIPLEINSSFDPGIPASLPEEALKPMFSLPAGALGTCIRNNNSLFFLLAPLRADGTYTGRLANGLDVEESSSLSCFKQTAANSITRLL